MPLTSLKQFLFSWRPLKARCCYFHNPVSASKLFDPLLLPFRSCSLWQYLPAWSTASRVARKLPQAGLKSNYHTTKGRYQHATTFLAFGLLWHSLMKLVSGADSCQRTRRRKAQAGEAGAEAQVAPETDIASPERYGTTRCRCEF